MKNKKNNNKININKIVQILAISCIAIYAICVFMGQQKTLNSYKNNKEYYSGQIAEQKKVKEDLTKLKQNINSPEYIEEIAREKLDMYLPNETVFVDIGK